MGCNHFLEFRKWSILVIFFIFLFSIEPAIDHAVLNLMRDYNKETQIVFNTYQVTEMSILFKYFLLGLKFEILQKRSVGWRQNNSNYL